MALGLSELSCHPPPLPKGALLSLSVTVSGTRALPASERRAGETTALVTPFAALAHKQSISNLPLLIRLLKASGLWRTAGRDIATWKGHIESIRWIGGRAVWPAENKQERRYE